MPVQIGDRPGADFNKPLQLLSDCHRRIEHFLEILQKVAANLQGGPLDHEHREALTAALRYFRDAAPLHSRDEEESLFPRLQKRITKHAPTLAAQISRLEADHQVVHAHHAQIQRIGTRWLEEHRLPPMEADELLRRLSELKDIYTEHIRMEDTQLFPAASEILAESELLEVGKEMAARRGIGRPQPVR